jgi:hypothetical protein
MIVVACVVADWWGIGENVNFYEKINIFAPIPA